MRIWEEREPVTHVLIAIHEYISTYEQKRTIWMDGRPHPSPNAPHTWMGFSTGVWEGDMLTVTTTHIKQGWYRRENLPSSDEATTIEHFVRNGDTLVHIQRYRGSGLSGGASDQDRGFQPEPQPEQLHAVLALRIHRRRAVGTRHRSPLSAGRESIRVGVCGDARLAAGCDAWGRGHDVSGIPKDDGSAADSRLSST